MAALHASRLTIDAKDIKFLQALQDVNEGKVHACPVDPQPKRAESVTFKLGAAPSAKQGCATSSKDSVPARLPKKRCAGRMD